MISDKRISVFYFKFLFLRFLLGILYVILTPCEEHPLKAKKTLYNFNKKKVQVVVPWLRHKEAECKSRSFFRGSSCSAKPSAFIFLKFQLRMGQHFAAFPEKRKTSVTRYTLIFENIHVFHSILLSEFSSYHGSQISFHLVQIVLFENFASTFPQHLFKFRKLCNLWLIRKRPTPDKKWDMKQVLPSPIYNVHNQVIFFPFC